MIKLMISVYYNRKSEHSQDRGRRIMSSRPAWAIEQDPVLQKKKKKKTWINSI
jgi:hypothetical protein